MHEAPASVEVEKRRFYRNGWVMFGVAGLLRFAIQFGCAPWLGDDVAQALARGASLAAIAIGMSGHDEPFGVGDVASIGAMMGISFAITFYFSR